MGFLSASCIFVGTFKSMEETENVVHNYFGKIYLASAHGYQNQECFLAENCVLIHLIYAVTLDICGY